MGLLLLLVICIPYSALYRYNATDATFMDIDRINTTVSRYYHSTVGGTNNTHSISKSSAPKRFYIVTILYG